MSLSGKIRKLFADSDVTVLSEYDDRIMNSAFSVLSKSEKADITPFEPAASRNITTSLAFRLAAAAVIIVTVGLAISLWDKPASAAYTIEQTIEAMRNVNTIHCFMNTYMDEQYEVWIEITPTTGEFKNVFLNSAEVTKVATPDGISCYYKNTNEVAYFKENSKLVNEIYFKPLIQDMVDSANSNSNSEMNIIESAGEKPLITVTLEKNDSTLKWEVDSETKLPISMNLISKEVLLPMKFNQSIYDISYNVPLPEGIFDIKIPEGIKVKGK